MRNGKNLFLIGTNQNSLKQAEQSACFVPLRIRKQKQGFRAGQRLDRKGESKMSDKKSVTMDQCMENIRTYIKKPENLELIEKAWDFAQKAHEGQYRKSGEP